MSDKFLRFTVMIDTGRTFELPLEKAFELLKEQGYTDVEKWNPDELAESLRFQDIDAYEKWNSVYNEEVEIAEVY